MPKRILVDATHTEETRVVVLENGRVAEFESETSIKKQLKGNIYLAKVTRVEPSLQAAFIEYGGDKHGFLPFSEIHPDYYDIPVSDKQALLESIRQRESFNESSEDEENAPSESDISMEESSEIMASNDSEESSSGDDEEGNEGDLKGKTLEPTTNENDSNEEESINKEIESNSSEDEENFEFKGENLYQKYKIQEVIKRNQILLVQVEKEERGNKGASLTTFLSLAGRYCVLMPNSLRRGGVSRRIDNYEDRRKLKAVIKELNIPEETGLIVRTAGAKKDAKDIKADYDYLVKLWNDIRKGTLESNAPAFIHAEGDIIKRTVRDLYNETVDELLIEGKAAFETAKDFMKIVMKEHVSRVKHYKNKVPMFSRYKVEEQIAALYEQEVPLESGGALVINPTEALISIDVNSGRSTSQKNVEETAVTTNVEAAYEIARQLRLRDLSGLIVIDFIDMMELKNKKSVERALKDALQNDKAKLQIGRISSFGLMEMSRQRLSASFLEINTMICPHCAGAGVVKASESVAVTVLRAIENDVSKGDKASSIKVFVASDVAVYILNNKREQVSNIEKRYDVKVIINIDNSSAADQFYIDKVVKKPTGDKKNGRSRSKKISAEANNNEDENTGQVIDFAEKSKKKNSKKPRKGDDSFGISGLLEGLWKKIVD